MPKSGPFTAFKLQMPNAADQKAYLNSMQTTVNLFEGDVDQLKKQRADETLPLKDLDYDTGKETRLGEYPLADQTYAQLLNSLMHQKNAEMPSDLRASMVAYYAPLKTPHRRRVYYMFHMRQDRKQRQLETNLLLLHQQQPATMKVAGLQSSSAIAPRPQSR